MTRFLLPALLLAAATPALAHPLPNFRFDRTVDVRLAPSGVVVKYALEMNEWTMVLDGNKLLQPGETFGTSREFAAQYAKKKVPFLIDNLVLTLDGREVKLAAERTEVEPERDHVRFRFVFRGAWSPPLGKKLAFAVEDHNFEDEAGKMTLTLDAGSGLVVHELTEPVGLRGRSPLDLKPGEDQLLRKASAVIEVSPATGPAADTPAPAQAEAAAAPEPVVVGEKPDLLRGLLDRGLVALLDSELGIGLLLLAAAAYGMAHAFEPGHGKTMLAAYLVGERGTVTHAFLLAGSTTLTHTGTVLAVAVYLRWRYGDHPPEEALGWLMLGGGLVVLVIALWLLSCRATGRADHVHLFAGHDHHHGDGHTHAHVPAGGERLGWFRAILLGIGGGLIPCWGAVALLLAALSSGQFWLALPLVVCFSVGLAAVLVVLGVVVVRTHASGGGRFGERRWFRALPVVAAFVLLALGLWQARAGAQLLTAHHASPPAGAAR